MTALALLTLVLSLVLAPSSSHAQAGAKTPRIGILTRAFDPHAPASIYEAFRQGLRDLGYAEGQSIVLEYRSAEGQDERFPALAAELVRLKVDLILAESAPAVRAAQQASGTIPIVFPAVFDPVNQGLVASLAHPGGHTTGVTFQDPELMGKRLELLKQAVPGVTRVAYLWHTTALTTRALHETETAAHALGVQLHPLEVRAPYPLDQVFATMAAVHPDALITQPSEVFFGRRTQLVDLAAQTQLPGMFPEREFAEAGGLMAYGSSVAANFRRAATYVDKILKGAKPADLPVEQPMKFELVLNLKTAQALGLTIPPTLLFQADEVIR
jgi:putative tryptophan/tyrosine transport system substrate-binding protein